jgi:transposase
LPELVVPDNLLSGVTKAHRYEPDLNPTYLEMATHYGVAIAPARVRKPKDNHLLKCKFKSYFNVGLNV